MSVKNSILVVEGSRTQAERLRLVLEKYNYAVSVATRGNEALEEARVQQPGLILSGVAVSGMNGYDLCAAFKQDPEVKNIPVVLLTAVNEIEDLLRGLRAKVDYYIAKPYEEDELAARIAAIMNGLVREEGAPGSEQLEMFVRGEWRGLDSERLQLARLLLATYENYGAALRQSQSLLTAQLQLKTQSQQLQEERDRFQAALKEPTSASASLFSYSTPNAGGGVAADGPRVLVMEDSFVSRALLARFLEKLACRVDVVANGNEALEAHQKRDYAAILIDVQTSLPEGLETVACIRQRESASGAHAPIIALTAHETPGDRERYGAAGVDDYLVKPITFAALQRVLAGRLSHVSVPSQTDSPLVAQGERG